MAEERIIRITENFPFKFRENTVVCIGGDLLFDSWVTNSSSRIKKDARERGFDFKNLRSMINGIPSSVRDYYFPGNDVRIPRNEALLESFKAAAGVHCYDCGFLVIRLEDMETASFFPMEWPDTQDLDGWAHSVLSRWPCLVGNLFLDDDILFSKCQQAASCRESFSNKRSERKNALRDKMASEHSHVSDAAVLDSLYDDFAAREAGPEDEISENEKACDEYIQVNRRELMKLGLSPEILAKLTGGNNLSKIHITRRGRILLEDYGKEIKLDDLSCALYLLFLRHEEGIRLKTLMDYENELLDLYQSVSGKDDKVAMRNTIRSLVDPENNSVNVLISRIKKEFVKAFNPNLAQHYYIDGPRGEEKSVSLDRSLIKWDTIRPQF